MEAATTKILTHSEMVQVAIMGIIDICGLIACIVLNLSGWIYGAKFIKKNNYLLGLEWWIVGISASSLVSYTRRPQSYDFYDLGFDYLVLRWNPIILRL